jgi:hypothetical protein
MRRIIERLQSYSFVNVNIDNNLTEDSLAISSPTEITEVLNREIAEDISRTIFSDLFAHADEVDILILWR